MSINFNKPECQTITTKRRFGLCDHTPPPSMPAYLDENEGENWIAVVHNDDCCKVHFTAIDNCVLLTGGAKPREKSCDVMLQTDESIIFVELKSRNEKGSGWVKEGIEQLLSTIKFFEASSQSNFLIKKAYVANNRKPLFRESQTTRMEDFRLKTGYVLRIENRIKLS
ncbi:MAG: hypothetical protein PHU33_15070 [Bacteroidales bacterium]|nr:hypothetical protein [Bacteroidales bacterium]